MKFSGPPEFKQFGIRASKGQNLLHDRRTRGKCRNPSFLKQGSCKILWQIPLGITEDQLVRAFFLVDLRTVQSRRIVKDKYAGDGKVPTSFTWSLKIKS